MIRLLLLAAGLAAALPSAAQAHPADPQARFRQSPAVLARYADVPVMLDAPALTPGRRSFTSQAELEAHLARLARRSPRLHLGSLGVSTEGRALPYAVFTAEGLSDSAAIRALNRPVVWLIGQQHGNEPAGGEALLAVASALADGELSPLLTQVTVVIVPRANPDGAAAAQRRTSAGLDLNRDHLLASLPETRAIQAGATVLPPDMVLDFHEYAAAGPWLSRFGVLAPWDAMFLHATHPSAPVGPARLAEQTFRPAMERRLARLGLSSHTFLAGPGAEAEDGIVPTGGTAPGISRNYFGLTGAVSLLVETRGGDAGREAFQRRVATHYLAAAAALEMAAAEAPRLRRTVAEARRQAAASRAPLPVGFTLRGEPATLTFIDSVTAADTPIQVELRDARRTVVTATRARPAGYILAPAAQGAVAALHVKGVRFCPAPRERLEVEAYRVTLRAGASTGRREGINPERLADVRLERRSLTPLAGSIYVPMGQAAAAVIAALLEPDAPGSRLAAAGSLDADGLAPVVRVPQGAPITCEAEALSVAE